MSRAAIVGSGLIGRAWALVFARAGWYVVMTDPSRDVLDDLADGLVEDCAILERHRLCGPSDEVLGRISWTTSVEEAVSGADFVQENGPEVCEVKASIFAEFDKHAPKNAVLASSTSAIVASRFTEDLAGRSRCLVGHPVNPPHLIPLVEVCAAPWTDPVVVERAYDVYRDIGQVPIIVKQEIDGFVLNRLQGAVLAEAFRLVRDGVVSPEDLDHTMKDGLGLRWSFMGPFETVDLNAPGGIADYCRRYVGFYKGLAEDPPTGDVFGPQSADAILAAWPHEADKERLERLTQWRNECLGALRDHKKRQQDA